MWYRSDLIEHFRISRTFSTVTTSFQSLVLLGHRFQSYILIRQNKMFKYLVNKYFLLKRRLSSFLQGQTAILKFLIFNVWELNLWLKVTFPFVKPTRISHLKKSNSSHNSTLVMIYFLVKVHWYAIVKVIWIVFSRLVLLRVCYLVSCGKTSVDGINVVLTVHWVRILLIFVNFRWKRRPLFMIVTIVYMLMNHIAHSHVCYDWLLCKVICIY